MSFLNARRAVLLGTLCAVSCLAGMTLTAQGKASVSVGALRIVGPGIGESADETRPFNEGVGMTIVLYVKAPTGAGIVYLDNEASVVDSATDDKGTDLRTDASFGSFPEIVKDGSAGMIELRLGGRPTKGATAVVAAGSVGVTSAVGTKPIKAPNVALVQGKTFKIGAIPITVGKVTVDDDSIGIEFNMPRQSLRAIKTMTFLDAKGQEIDSDRVGTGYTNDVGELDMRVKTKEKTVTVSCDVWQALKTEKVPFKVSAGLGL
jgi:hypothetical protein